MPLPAPQMAAGQPFGQQAPPVPAQAPPFAAPPAMPTPGPNPGAVAVNPEAAGTVPSAAADMSGTQQVSQPAHLAASQDLPAEAADADVIEPEWVDKAKAVVAATRQDPYRQVREMNQLKAEYMKKRYNKDIKLPDA